ncbi:antitoxin MazE-like protein [Streptomyces sp. NPDC051994]
MSATVSTRWSRPVIWIPDSGSKEYRPSCRTQASHAAADNRSRERRNRR